ncbi:MAG: FtsX-like permease family protein [Elusimicrobia bacterium]|nr:FtsX-like permease family protein [Elusimicrobiota bacterium]
MTLGNGIITGMNDGIKKNIVNAFMGDIVLISDKQKTDNVFFDFMGASVEPISTYKQIDAILKTQNYVDRYLPVGKNLAMILQEDENTPSPAYLLGVNIVQYQKMFPNSFKVIEGRLLKPGERGILIPTHVRNEHIYTAFNTWIIPENGKLIKQNMTKEALENIQNITISSSIVLMGMANGVNSATDVRFVVKGIVKYNALKTMFGHFCITDIESYRECLGYFSTADTAVDVPKEEKKLLTMGSSDLDSMFGSESLVISNTQNKAPKLKKSGTSAQKEQTNIESGIYNIVFVKLKDGVSYQVAIAKLNRVLSESKTGVRAITWNKASGPIGSMAIIIKGALFVFVTILFCVAVIIIINTLTMAALERTSEIGMMRAVGARKSFIGGMFIGETGILSAVFGGAGIITGIIIVKLIPLFKITTSNDMVQLLYGGDIFHPVLMVPDISLTVLQLIFVTIIAALYPVGVARGITPLDAISRD